eukprot:m.379407 g.379407  ORF g.379407 m.379407 type:complete len:92 (-) comp20030_c0_seq4:646-921(-)
MPTLDHDPQCINKKLHIGNDHVTIVFNDSGEPFERSSLAGAVNYVFIVLKPQDDEHFSVDFDVKVRSISRLAALRHQFWLFFLLRPFCLTH